MLNRLSSNGEAVVRAFNITGVEGYIDKSRKKNTFIYKLKNAVISELIDSGVFDKGANLRLKDKIINDKGGYFIVNLLATNDKRLGISVYGALELTKKVGRPYAKLRYGRALVYYI